MEFETRSFVSGRFVVLAGQPVLVRNPCSYEVIASVNGAAPRDVDAAVLAARAAFESGPWPRLLPFDRAQYLSRIAQSIEARAEDIARIDVLSSGKPLKGARREVLGAARVFSYYAGLAPDLCGSTIPLDHNQMAFTTRDPVGVVAQIVPWNFPFLALAWKLAPALAAGCTSILKTSPLTPLSALVIGTICQAIEMPPGVVNILTGEAEVGSALVTHPGVDMVSFTGSTSTGVQVMKSAADDLKRVALELGGKSPSLIFADADLHRAAEASARAVFGNSGQSCSARSRIYVESDAYDEFVDCLKSATRALRIGAPLDEETDLGPLISADQWQRVDGFVRDGKREGARLALGGHRPQGLQSGHYYEPTIFTEATNDMRITREEIFGPVVAVSRMEEVQSLRLANASPYGLSASIWSKDTSRALRIAKDLRVGTIAINTHPSASQVGLFLPFGGFKQSGIGRELGRQGIELYTEIKSVLVGLQS